MKIEEWVYKLVSLHSNNNANNTLKKQHIKKATQQELTMLEGAFRQVQDEKIIGKTSRHRILQDRRLKTSLAYQRGTRAPQNADAQRERAKWNFPVN